MTDFLSFLVVPCPCTELSPLAINLQPVLPDAAFLEEPILVTRCHGLRLSPLPDCFKAYVLTKKNPPGGQKKRGRAAGRRASSRTQEDSIESFYYVGLDVHKKTISYAVKTAAGKKIAAGSIAATRAALTN